MLSEYMYLPVASLLPWLEEVAGTWHAFFQLKHTRSEMDNDQSCIQLIWRVIQFVWPPCAGAASISSNVAASEELPVSTRACYQEAGGALTDLAACLGGAVHACSPRPDTAQLGVRAVLIMVEGYHLCM